MRFVIAVVAWMGRYKQRGMTMKLFSVLFVVMFLALSCSSPTKPKPEGVCILVLTHLATGLRMTFDTVVTCDDCYKIQSYGGYTVQSWTQNP